MTDDEIIDKLLIRINLGTPVLFWSAYKGINAVDSDVKIESILDEMLKEALIKKDAMGTDDMPMVILTKLGIDVIENGGWLKHKVGLMSDDQKVHKLLAFMDSTGEYHWTPDSLAPAFDGLLNEHEIEFLGQILIDNGDVNDSRTKDGFAIGFSQKSKSVFHGKKYLKTRLNQEIKFDIGQIQNIKDSVINAPVSQSRDQVSFDKAHNKVINAAPEETKQKSKTWTASNMIFVILTGIIVGLLVLMFWEKIRVFFE